MTTNLNPRLTVVRRSSRGDPRTFRVTRPAPSGLSTAAAYRRLTAAILRLDVASLASDLRAARLGHKELAAAA